MVSSHLKLFYIYTTTLICLNPQLIFPIALRSEELNSFTNPERRVKTYNNDFNNIKYRISYNLNKEFKQYLEGDFIKFRNYFIELIALNDDSETNKNFLDIESDIQYEKENIFYAEGNAILYFSNAILKGDQISYDKAQKKLSVIGNVFFQKGNQYFEASKIVYNLQTEEGHIEDIYGVLDVDDLSKDFEFKNIQKKNKISNSRDISDLEYINSIRVGLINDFNETKKFNITQLDFDIPQITKWRYKSNKISLKNEIMESNKIYFTNDAFNKPQFILESNDFNAKFVEEKLKLTSTKTWIILENKLRMPIGKRTIFDKDPVSSWGIGNEYKEKDGFYISRNFKNIEIDKNFNLKLRPYFLIQRAYQGTTKAFRAPKSSLLSSKVENGINKLDFFALDASLNGTINDWNIYWTNNLNSFNPKRFSESLRTKIIFQKSINLNKNHKKKYFNLEDDFTNNNFIYDSKNQENKKNYSKDFLKDIKIVNNKLDDPKYLKYSFSNYLDVKLTSAFRENISKGYSGESEIYFGNSISLANRKSWTKGDRVKGFTLIYDFGKFKAKSKIGNKFGNLYRNVFAAQYGYQFPIWKKNLVDKNIDISYKYSPRIINQGIIWTSNIQSASFLYSNGASQEGLSLSSGPQIKLGNLKNNFLDYTKLNLTGIYAVKSGKSPFEFDDIGKDFKLNLELRQQIMGPLLLTYRTSYNFKNDTFSLPIYNFDISRRAYSIGSFYNVENKSVGFSFNIFNFDFSGLGSIFN